MKLNATHDNIIDFVSKNPNREAKKIVSGTKLKADVVFPAIKKLVEAGILGRKEKGKKLSYSVMTTTAKEEPAFEETPVPEEAKEEATGESEAELKEKEKPKSGRDTTKFKFNSAEYGKGPLVLAVVRKYLEDKPKTTLTQLMKTFPPELLNRFGIVAELKDAQKLSGERNRYFMKPEQIIKLKDSKTVVVCNQFTAQSLKPFLETAKKLGYAIK